MTTVTKVATKPKTIGIVEAFELYAKSKVQADSSLIYLKKKGEILRADKSVLIKYKTFRNILCLYYIKAGIKLIQGYALDLGSGLGDIFVMRQERNPNVKPRLNKGESFKLKKKLEAEGKPVTADNWKIYYTDSEFTRTNWMRPNYVPNLQFYKFVPAGGKPGKGFRQILSHAILTNPVLTAIYPFIPAR